MGKLKNMHSLEILTNRKNVLAVGRPLRYLRATHIPGVLGCREKAGNLIRQFFVTAAWSM